MFFFPRKRSMTLVMPSWKDGGSWGDRNKGNFGGVSLITARRFVIFRFFGRRAQRGALNCVNGLVP